MQANPVAIFALIIAFVIMIMLSSGGSFSIFSDGGGGPLATGPSTSGVRNPQPLSTGFFGGSFAPSPTPVPQPLPGESPYRGKIRISAVERGGTHPDAEYVVLRYSGGSDFGGSSDPPLDVTGWTIGTPRAAHAIPRAYHIPEFDAAERNIVLPPGGDLVIVVGVTTYRRNFRENGCVGYLAERHTFRPPIASSCFDVSRNRSDLLRLGFNGACIDTIQSQPPCRKPIGPFSAGIIGAACIDYMNDHFSYVGCVADNRDRNDFLRNVWRVELGRSQKLFDPRHDRVILRDKNGLMVDEFEY